MSVEKDEERDEFVNRFFRSVCIYYKTLSNRIDFDDDSECSSEEEQQEIKKEVKQDDCDSQANH